MKYHSIMCPICLANLVLAAVGAACTGGVAALSASKTRFWAACKQRFCRINHPHQS